VGLPVFDTNSIVMPNLQPQHRRSHIMKKRIYSIWVSLVIVLAMSGSGNALAGGLVEVDFDTVGFTTPLLIDNQYWPQVAGTVSTYFAETDDGCEWNRVDVTYSTDNIDGIAVRVVLDQEWLDESDDCADELDNYPGGFPYGDLAEKTHDWYAQDDSGNIWYLGEHTVSLDADKDECDDWANPDGVFALTGCLDGSFKSGEDGAEAGLIMLAYPSKGDFYQQEFDEDNAEDWARVLNFVPIEDNEDCLKTKEWSPLEPGSVEHKYYCPGGSPNDGLILIEEVSGGPKVWVELIDVTNY